MNLTPLIATISANPTAQPIIVNVTNPQNTTTDYVAWAGLILAVLLGLFEFYKFMNDKAKLKVMTRFNQEIMTHDRYGKLTNQSTGKTYWTVEVANTGSKNIVIKSISFRRNDTSKESMLTEDYSGKIERYTLVPHESHSYTIPEELLNPRRVTEVHLLDATGKIHRKKIRN